jgi:hypothetical protein
MTNLNKMKKCELIEYCEKLNFRLNMDHNNELLHKKLIEENQEIKINTMKCCKDLGNKNEKLIEENELLTNSRIELEIKYKKVIDNLEKELEYYKNFKSKFNDFVKGHEISSKWGKEYTP